MAQDDPLLIARDGAVLTLTLNRPASLNAIDQDLAERLLAALQEADGDPAIRAVLLQGAGKGFTAGGDISDFAGDPDALADGIARLIAPIHASMLTIRGLSKPVIGAAHGVAAGVGVSLLAACDMVIAGDGTKFTTAYVGIGGSPDGGMSWTLPRKVGTARAAELIMTGQRFSAEQAERWGLVNRVVPEAELAGAAIALARQLAGGPTLSLAGIKRLLDASFTSDFASQLDAEAAQFARITETEDCRAGVAAFLNKEKPTFKGR